MCVVLCHSFCLLLVFLDRIVIILTVIFIKSETSSFRTLTHTFFKKPLLGKTTRGVKKEHFTGEVKDKCPSKKPIDMGIVFQKSKLHRA